MAEHASRSNHSITALTVRGYKSIANAQRIELRPLTVLAGANSSGKSSMLQPLLLLKQTLEVEYQPDVLLLDGPNVKFTRAEQLLSSVGRRRSSFEIGVEVDGRYVVQPTYRKVRSGFDVASMSVAEDGWTASFTRNMPSNQVQRAMLQHLSALPRAVRSLAEAGVASWVVLPQRCFLLPGLAEPMVDGEPSLVMLDTLQSVELARTCIREVIHVPAWRGSPQRNYPTSGATQLFTGTFDNYVASVIAQLQLDRSRRWEQLAKDLSALGLTSRVEARRIDEARIELLVGRLPVSIGSHDDLVNIADVGFGVSQSLPVVLALLVARAGQLVYVEEPEIHLHPKAQFALAGIALQAARRGVRVVFETHSSLLLRGLQTAVARREISPSQVALHWFSRLPSTGATSVSTADLASDGSFGEWPADFDEVVLGIERDYLDAS
jgi:predicted ATPase